MGKIKDGTYLDGFYRGISAMRNLFAKLDKEGRLDLIREMIKDTELTSLLLQKYDLISDDEYEFLSEKADEEWEGSHDSSASSGNMPDISSVITEISGNIDKDRELRIQLLEKLSDECEDELYNQVATGADDELYETLLKKYHIQ